MSDEGRSYPGLAAEAAHATPAVADALSEMYRAHFPALCAFIRRKFGAGPPEPEDVAQAAFTQYANLPNRAAVENPRAYLYRCAQNYVLDQHRRQAISARAASDIVTLGHGLTPAGDDPSRVLEGRDDLAAVLAALEALDPRRRAVLIWHSIDELSCAEIARRMKLSPTRVIQLYADALAACAKALRAQSGEDRA